jgi:alkylation response protein AidB-like acyl-CoA dehydrogenase
MDRFELRRQDFSLDENQEAVREAFAEFFAKESPTSVVRAAEPLGYDKALWSKLLGMGVATMSLPASQGGDDATLVDLVLIAGEYGRSLSPVPLISHVAATRLLSRAGAPTEILDAALHDERIFTLAPQPVAAGRPQLVPDAAIATCVIALADGRLALYAAAAPGPHVPNQGCTPLAWWQPDHRSEQYELATGSGAAELFAEAVREWKLLMAAALVEMTQSALGIAVEFAKTRETLGVPIGTLQGVAFPLTEVAIAVAGGRNLVRKAAWTAQYEPGARPELALMAFNHAVRTATHGTTTSAHMQGGLGFTVEADASLYFLRAKGWSALAGDPAADLAGIGAQLTGAVAQS